jgi:hypothetical protein
MQGNWGVGFRTDAAASSWNTFNVTQFIEQLRSMPGKPSWVIVNLSGASHSGDRYISYHELLLDGLGNANATPERDGRDLFKELADAIHGEGLKIIAYMAAQGPALLKLTKKYHDRILQNQTHAEAVAGTLSHAYDWNPETLTSPARDKWLQYVSVKYDCDPLEYTTFNWDDNRVNGAYSYTCAKQAYAEEIVKYYSNKFGSDIDGYWFDQGLYANGALIEAACHEGNPNAVVAFNNGVKVPLKVNNPGVEDYTFGHPNPVRNTPPSSDENEDMVRAIEASADGYIQSGSWEVLGHMFMPMSESSWNGLYTTIDPGWSDNDGARAKDWTSRVLENGGAWTWNIPMASGDGDPSRMSILAEGHVAFLNNVTTQITPSAVPSVSQIPSRTPSAVPSNSPSAIPSNAPSSSHVPSRTPSALPSLFPSAKPSRSPSTSPSQEPSEPLSPSGSPSAAQSDLPSNPSNRPSVGPSTTQSEQPSSISSFAPSVSTKGPSPSPSAATTLASLKPSSGPASNQQGPVFDKCVLIPEEENTCSSTEQGQAKPTCTPYRSPDHCPADESFSLLINGREMHVKQNLELLEEENHWFQFLDDRGAAYAFTRSKGIPTPTIHCCIDDLDQLGACFNSGSLLSKFVIHASGLHSNAGTFVFPDGFSGSELISGLQMSLEDVIGSLKTNSKAATKYIVEEFVSASTLVPKLPQEYKLHVFNGKFGSATVMLNRGSDCQCYLEVDEKWARLDRWGCFVPSMPMGWNKDGDSCYDIDFRTGLSNPYQFKGFDTCGDVAPPDACVWEMLLEYGRQLSESIGVYMRIDMFVTDDNRIYVQEYSRSHNGGLRHCAAKLSDEDGCVDSCFLGRNWKNAGGDSLYGGPKLTRPVFLEGYHTKAAEDQCLVIKEAPSDTSSQRCVN